MAKPQREEKPKHFIDDKYVAENYNLGDGLIVDGVKQDSKSWKVIEDDKYKPDKAAYVLKRFQEKFGITKFKNSDTCYSLASRNKMIGDFLGVVNSDYALVEKAPTYFRDVVEAKEFSDISEDLTAIRALDRDEANELRVLSENYKKDCNNVKIEYERLREPKITSVNMNILMIKSNELPLTLSMAIDAYTVTDEGNLPSKKAYASELLINYKRALLKYYNGLTEELKNKFNLDEFLQSKMPK